MNTTLPHPEANQADAASAVRAWGDLCRLTSQSSSDRSEAVAELGIRLDRSPDEIDAAVNMLQVRSGLLSEMDNLAEHDLDRPRLSEMLMELERSYQWVFALRHGSSPT